MRSKYVTYLLADVIDLIGGGTPNTNIPEYWDGDIHWLSVKDFNNDERYVFSTEKSITKAGLDNSSTKMLNNDDIIISARGTVGELAMVPFPMAFNQSCYGIRGKKGIIVQTYLYYLLRDSIRLLKSHTHGSVFDTITRDTFARIEVNLPSIDEQHIIADILIALDDRISVNKAINHHLEQMAQAMFKSWFIGFEPFGGKMPSKWRKGTISDLGDVIGGSTPSKAKPQYYTEHGIAWVTPKDLSVNKNKFIAHGANDISELGLRNSSAQLMPRGTVLFSSRAPIGYIAIASGELSTNQGFKSIVPKKNVGTAFIYYFLINNIQTIENVASGSTFKEVSGTTMKSIPAVIPDEDSLRRFQDECTPIFNKQELLEAENACLAETRDTLLPRLMSGELSVADLGDAK
ncbi:restriction endonuclease subunit S [Pectobacterium aroidearum]|uniref:restriction endonuclease subunit S n=1 Tax=Pectobacterium aroidearum TaxID=1201031 RepID=UPI0032F066C9